MSVLASTLLVGVGATSMMDIWGVVRKKLFGIAPPNYGLVGRWLGHMLHNQFRHKAIATAPRISGEQITGWCAHYAIGVSFAALLVLIWGGNWLLDPTISPALIVGVGTVAAPLFIMQPAMGAGVASRLSPRPWFARIQSVITHVVFGAGLYVSAWLLQMVDLILS